MPTTTYPELSKKIGWEGPPVKIPSVNEAKALRIRVLQGDDAAAEEVFRIYRFAPSPTTLDESLSMNEINGGYIVVCQMFR